MCAPVHVEGSVCLHLGCEYEAGGSFFYQPTLLVKGCRGELCWEGMPPYANSRLHPFWEGLSLMGAFLCVGPKASPPLLCHTPVGVPFRTHTTRLSVVLAYGGGGGDRSAPPPPPRCL